MAKNNNVWFCSECGTEYSKWQGQCNGCKAWNTLVEQPKINTKSPNKSTIITTKRKALKRLYQVIQTLNHENAWFLFFPILQQ